MLLKENKTLKDFFPFLVPETHLALSLVDGEIFVIISVLVGVGSVLARGLGSGCSVSVGWAEGKGPCIFAVGLLVCFVFFFDFEDWFYVGR